MAPKASEPSKRRRALLPAVVAVLDRLGLLDDERRRGLLQPLARPALRNYRRTAVGQVRPVVVLQSGGAT